MLEVTEKTNESHAINFLKSSGAVEVKVESAEEGWWLGRYDRATLAYEKGQKSVIA